MKMDFIKNQPKDARPMLKELLVAYEHWKKTDEAEKRRSVISDDFSDRYCGVGTIEILACSHFWTCSDGGERTSDEMDRLNDVIWEFDVMNTMFLLCGV